MLRRILIAALLAGVFVPTAGAAGVSLAPGITYTRQLVFTPHGPEVVHVMTVPKPGGLYALHPVLSNSTVVGRETVTSMQKRLSSTATVGGVNADLYTWNDGTPDGMFMDSGVMTTPPHPRRSTVGVTNDGRLLVDQVAMIATWQGSSQRRPMTGLNQPAGPEGVSLFTSAWGSVTPPANDTIEVVLNSFPPVAPLTDLTGTVVAAKPAGGTAIPPGGAVLVGRGASAGRLATEAQVGQQITVRLVLRPQWNDVVDAVGGGPLIVQNGRPIFRAGEEFTGTQLSLRRARTAVGQRADGKIVLVAVDGALPGYSTGMTNFELAQQLVRLGAVTASALDSGTSTTMAFDGKLINRPSDPGGERGVADGLFVFYYGVQAPAPATDVISPNGDGVDEAQQLSYKVVRPSTVTASLIGPDGVVRQTQTGPRGPGHVHARLDGPHRTGRARARGPLALGRERRRRPRTGVAGGAGLLPQQHTRLPAGQPVARGRPPTRGSTSCRLPARTSGDGHAQDPHRERRDGADRPPQAPRRDGEHPLERALRKRDPRILGPVCRQCACGERLRPDHARAPIPGAPRPLTQQQQPFLQPVKTSVGAAIVR